jgi:thioester reductase-like protein
VTPAQHGPASFLTGATGFIGAEILRRLLAREPERRIYALTRAPDQAAADRRGREVLFKLYTDDRELTGDAKRRVRWIVGDLSTPGLGLSAADRAEIAAECGEVIHAAASTDWDLTIGEAESVNFAGVTAIADLAADMNGGSRTVRLVHISTAYVAGKREGLITPDDLPGPDDPFNNTYEQTKARAERYLRQRMGELPVTVVRPSIVVGDSVSGRTFNFNVLYFPIKLLHRGLLKIAPGRPTTRLDIVPVDYVCDATITLGRDAGTAGATFHITADEDAMPLQEFGRHIAAFFNQRPGATKRVGVPLIIGPGTWRVVRWILSRSLRGRARRQFDAFNIYLPYILSAKRFEASATRRALGDQVPYPPITSYLSRVAEYAVTREWGRDVSWDPALLDTEV